MFPRPSSLVGPAFRLEARIYGKDISYPLPIPLTTVAKHVLKGVVEIAWGAVVKDWDSTPSAAATIEGVNTSAALIRLDMSATEVTLWAMVALSLTQSCEYS